MHAVGDVVHTSPPAHRKPLPYSLLTTGHVMRRVWFLSVRLSVALTVSVSVCASLYLSLPLLCLPRSLRAKVKALSFLVLGFFLFAPISCFLVCSQPNPRKQATKTGHPNQPQQPKQPEPARKHASKPGMHASKASQSFAKLRKASQSFAKRSEAKQTKPQSDRVRPIHHAGEGKHSLNTITR